MYGVPPCAADEVAPAAVAATVVVAPMFDALVVNVVGAEWWPAAAEPAARSSLAVAPGAGAWFAVEFSAPSAVEICPGAVPAIAIAPAKDAVCPASASGFGVDLAEPFVALAVHRSAGFLVGAHVHLTGCESVDGFDFSVGCVVVATPGWRAVVLLAQFAAACGVQLALRYSHRCATPSAALAGGD